MVFVRLLYDGGTLDVVFNSCKIYVVEARLLFLERVYSSLVDCGSHWFNRLVFPNLGTLGYQRLSRQIFETGAFNPHLLFKQVVIRRQGIMKVRLDTFLDVVTVNLIVRIPRHFF